MPWKKTDRVEQRYDLVRQMEAGAVTVSELCREANISRQTAYKWRKRYRTGRLKGLADRSHVAGEIFGRPEKLWLERVRRVRRRRPTWGARKLHHWLGLVFGAVGLPSVAAISRWLRHWGLARGRKRRKPGPVVLRAVLRPARRSNEVWTVDFKGSYRTGEGTRVEPLTVRDLHSRYGFVIGLQDSVGWQETRKSFRKIFNQYGVPERIRCDNGTPFGGAGPTGLTRLSAWWVKLGIAVEFIAPGRPDQNGAHEQFHRVYKKEVAKNPARTVAGQQRRSNRWLKSYNEQRPHEALGMKVPADCYQKNCRKVPKGVLSWKYGRGWKRHWVKGNGEISRKGKRRFIGEAFVGDYVGLKRLRAKVWQVYFGPILIGELHEEETGNLRTACYRRAK
jgi:transposase InsO family protein